jgi:hypothetical protein
MKLIFAAAFCLGAVLTFGFIQTSKQDKQQTTQQYVSNNTSFVVIDNCQYIVSNFRPLVLTHKGNCTNHIH